MQIQFKDNQKTMIVRLKGELDHHRSAQIRNLIEESVMKHTTKHLIFDFSELTFMDSSGIGMLIGRYKLMKALGGSIALVCNNQRIEALITMSGLKRLIAMYHTVEQALKQTKEEQA